MKEINLAAFRSTPLVQEPFEYLIVPGFIRPEACSAIHADYPRIDDVGSFPVEELTYGQAFASFLQTLKGAEFRQAFAEKFQVDLTDRPVMVTVRGQSGTRDGSIHTDAQSKIITVLIYMNPKWEEPGGRLRLLRSPTDIDDVIVEVPPVEGTLLAFRRSDNSYHGHKPFIGPRRVIQLNWVNNLGRRRYEVMRHRVSAWMKRMMNLFRGSHMPQTM
jgi:SM-20-related protein